MNKDKKCLEFEMPKMPKVKNKALLYLTPYPLRARGSTPLQTLIFLDTDERGSTRIWINKSKSFFLRALCASGVKSPYIRNMEVVAPVAR